MFRGGFAMLRTSINRVLRGKTGIILEANRKEAIGVRGNLERAIGSERDKNTRFRAG